MGKQIVWETMVQSCSRMRSHGSQPQSVADPPPPRITVPTHLQKRHLMNHKQTTNYEGE